MRFRAARVRPPRSWRVAELRLIRHWLFSRTAAFAIAAVVAIASQLGAWLETSGAQSTAKSPPLVGFSFSPTVFVNENPDDALRALLDDLEPDLVRLPIYWEQVNPTPETFDFSQVDRFIGIVADHNRRMPARPTRIVLAVGARNFVYPEVHVPGWLAATEVNDLGQLSGSSAYYKYLDVSYRRYAAEPLLYAWQIENEPLDDVRTVRSRHSALPRAMVQSEIKALRKIDPVHPFVVTTFNSDHVALDRIQASPLATRLTSLRGVKPVGHPSQALAVGDALGLDLYVVGPWTLNAREGADQRIAWKQQTLDYWSRVAHRKGKEVWITEMQAAPWQGTNGFTPGELVTSARAYRGHGASVVLVWGVEDWLKSPEWMSAGVAAFQILRSPSPN